MGPGAETRNNAVKFIIPLNIMWFLDQRLRCTDNLEGLHQQIKQSIVNLYILVSELDSSIERVDRKFDGGAFLFLFNFSPWLPT